MTRNITNLLSPLNLLTRLSPYPWPQPFRRWNKYDPLLFLCQRPVVPQSRPWMSNTSEAVSYAAAFAWDATACLSYVRNLKPLVAGLKINLQSCPSVSAHCRAQKCDVPCPLDRGLWLREKSNLNAFDVLLHPFPVLYFNFFMLITYGCD